MAPQVLRRQLMARMLRQAGIVDPVHQRMGLEKPGDGEGVFGVLPLPEAQGLQPLEELEGVEGAQTGPDIPEPEDPRPEGEGDVPHPRQIAEGFPEFETVVPRVRFGEFRELAVSPVEFSAVDDHAAYRGPVTADELRRGGRQDVGAEIERPHKPHADGVVHHKRDPRPVGDPGDRLEIGDVDLRVSDRFGIDGPRLVRDCRRERLGLFRIDEPYGSSQFGQRIMEQLVGPAVEVVAGDDLIAEARDRQEPQRDCRHPRRDAEGARASLQGGDSLLKDIGRRIHDPRIDVSERLQREEIRCMVRILENIGCGLIDGHRPRARRRIRVFLTGMHRQGIDFPS